MIRFAALDFLRGLGVFVALGFLFFQFIPLADPFLPGWIILMPLFPLISGAAFTVNSLQRIHRHPWALVFRWTLWHGLGLVILGLLGKFIFTLALPGSFPVGRYGGLLPHFLGFTEAPQVWFLGLSDTLTTLGVALVPFSLVMRFIFRQDVEEHFVRHWISLALWALGSTLIYQFFSGLDRSFWQNNLALQWLVTGLSPLTLALSGLFSGALLGLPLVTKFRPWVRWSSFLVPLVSLGVISLLQVQGFHGIAGAVPFATALIGVFLFALSLGIIAMAHPDKDKTTGWFRRFSRPFRIYGRLPLTVFLLAPLTLMGLIRGLEALGIQWSLVPFWGLGLLALGFAALWGGLLKIWKRGAYRGSPDWLLQYALRFTGKPSGRLLFLKEDE